MRKLSRRKGLIKQKSLFLILAIDLAFWILLASIVLFIDPYSLGAIPIFLVTIFFATLIPATFILMNKRRGILTSSGLVFFLFLRYIGIGNILNLLLIIGVVLALEFYLSNRNN
mgnify:CR=1 FL=1